MSTALLVMGALALWMVMSVIRQRGKPLYDPAREVSTRTPSEGSLIFDSPPRARVEVPLALLTDYYEHGIEHTPPRDPSGAMQRRERYYAAPVNPFRLVRAKLSAASADAALRKELDEWEAGWRAGRPTDPVRAMYLEQRAAASSLGAQVLVEVGRAMAYLDDDRCAAAWFRAGLSKVMSEYAGKSPGDPSALPLLHALSQTKALWRLRDYPALEKRFTLEAALYPPLSAESRRAGCLRATSLFYQGRYDDACDAIFKVWEQDKQAGDLGALEKSDWGEMYWVTSLYLYCARRYDDAVPYYESFLKTDDGRKAQGTRMLIYCLANAGRADEARARLPQFCAEYGWNRNAESRRLEDLIDTAARRREAQTQPATRP